MTKINKKQKSKKLHLTKLLFEPLTFDKKFDSITKELRSLGR